MIIGGLKESTALRGCAHISNLSPPSPKEELRDETVLSIDIVCIIWIECVDVLTEVQGVTVILK